MTRKISSQKTAQNYGPLTANEGLPNCVMTYGLVRQVEIYFDYLQANAGLPASAGANGELDAAVISIPANSFLDRALVKVDTDEGFDDVGNTATLDIGLEALDGSVIDLDGIGQVAVGLLTANTWHILAGALLQGSSGSTDTQISINDGTEVFTQGKGRLIVEYLPAHAA